MKLMYLILNVIIFMWIVHLMHFLILVTYLQRLINTNLYDCYKPTLSSLHIL